MNKLIGKFYGWINGVRIYREKRGVFHAQKTNKPNECLFSGTKKEIEFAFGAKIVKNSH